MKNHNDQAIEKYFSSMLSEKKTATAPSDSPSVPLERLSTTVSTLPEELVFSKQENLLEPSKEPEIVIKPEQNEDNWKNLDLGNEFQVLFFEIAELIFAVPLIELGGIHHLELPLKASSGKADWFMGVMTHGESLYNIVDTAKWVKMDVGPDSLNYTHYVLLGATGWGLSCEKLLGTEVLMKEQINWREVGGERPWLAGMVKNRKCALIHVQELVKLLNNGLNIYGH